MERSPLQKHLRLILISGFISSLISLFIVFADYSNEKQIMETASNIKTTEADVSETATDQNMRIRYPGDWKSSTNSMAPTISWQPAEPGTTKIVINAESPYSRVEKNVAVTERWISRTEDLNEEEWIKRPYVDSYYHQRLMDNGWVYSYTHNGIRIHGSASDGPLGGTWSLVKVIGDQIYLAEGRRHGKVSAFYGPQNDPPYKCPCSDEYEISLSEPVPLSSLGL